MACALINSQRLQMKLGNLFVALKMCKEALELMRELGSPDLDAKDYMPYLSGIYDKILKSGKMTDEIKEEVVNSKIR